MNKRIYEIIAKYASIPEEEIKDSSSLALDCGLNSFEIVNVIVDFENEFNIEFNEQKLSNLKTVEDIVSCVGHR